MSIIKSFSVGNGDMFYIKHGSDNFTIIDCCIDDTNKESIMKEIKKESSSKSIIRFISTHPDDDHIKGLEYFNKNKSIANFYCVKNSAIKEDETDDFKCYCQLRDSDKAFYIYKDCKRKWMNRSDDERGASGINILWPITSNSYFKDALESAKEGNSPNNISPIISYSLEEGAKVLWFGDLENTFTESIKDEITLPKADIIFAPHHGRQSGNLPTDWLKVISPQIIIIGEAPSEDLNYYSGYNTITQNSAGDIIFECNTGKVHIYVSNSNYSVNFLEDENRSNTYGNYIGTLNI